MPKSPHIFHLAKCLKGKFKRCIFMTYDFFFSLLSCLKNLSKVMTSRKVKCIFSNFFNSSSYFLIFLLLVLFFRLQSNFGFLSKKMYREKITYGVQSFSCLNRCLAILVWRHFVGISAWKYLCLSNFPNRRVCLYARVHLKWVINLKLKSMIEKKM